MGCKTSLIVLCLSLVATLTIIAKLKLLPLEVEEDHSVRLDSARGTTAFRTLATKRRQLVIVSHSSPAAIGNSNHEICSDRLCTNLLSGTSYNLYQDCGDLTTLKINVTERDISYECVFRDGRGHDPVALVSCMGSGNTWVRGLLEKATGICTGAIFCDADLRAKGFMGESVRDGSVLVTKTHVHIPQWMNATGTRRISINPLYAAAILIIRNPFDTIVAEENRLRSKSHIALTSMEHFGSNRAWSRDVHRVGNKWKTMLVNWVESAQRFHKPLLVVRYEDVKRDKVREVSRMLDFLHQDYDKTELAARLEAGFEDFHRPHAVQNNYDRYTEEQKTFVRSLITSAMETLKPIKTEGLKLNDYLN